MPAASEILSGLYAISNDFRLIAILWHAVFYGLLLLLAGKRSPSNKLLATCMSIPLFSVSVFAWITTNPFNGSLFLILASLTLIFGLRASAERISFSSWPFAVAGLIMIFFGLIYPHFLETDSLLGYLYASPVGLIPCPTLSTLIGLTLLCSRFASRPITLILVASGIFYGLFGVFRLHVHLDIVLLLGAVILLIQLILPPGSSLMIKEPTLHAQ